mgnify:CR=1 FL=1
MCEEAQGMFSEKAKKHADACRFCWMCRHLCPVQLVTGKETNTPRAKGLLVSMIVIKVLICIIIVMGIIIRLFNVALGSGLILSFLIIVVIYFSKRIRKRSLSMEKQFLENFQGTAGTFPQEEPETGETSTEKNHELSNK